MKHRAISLLLALAATIMLSTPCAAESGADYYEQALSRHRAGELRQAARLYTKAIEHDPELIMAYQMRGAAWQKLHKFRKASGDYTVLIERGEPYFQAVGYYNRGIVNTIMERYVEAITDFTGAVEIDPKMGEAWFRRAVARVKSGDSTGTIQDLRQAARFGDTDAKQWLDLLSPGWKEAEK